MHNQLKQQLGITYANCFTCAYFYPPILCTHSKQYVRSTQRSFPFKKEQKCWTPSFWKSNCAVLVLTEEQLDASFAKFERIRNGG